MFLKTLLAILTIAFTPILCVAEFRIGFIGGFSGSGKVFGETPRNGFEMAREEFGERGISVVYEDNEWDPKKTISAFNKLVDHDRVDCIIALGSTPVSTIAPLAERRGIPLIAWASAEHIAKGRRWVIRSWPSGANAGEALAEKAKQLGIKKLVELIFTDEYSISVRNGVTASLEGVISLGEVAWNVHDFSSTILLAKQRAADGIFICLAPGQMASFAIQAHRMGLKVPMLGCDILDNPDEQALSKGALDGAWYATVPVSPEFHQRYVQRYGAGALIAGAAVHYEIYRLLSEIAESSPTRERIREHLLSVRNRESTMGRFDAVSEGGDQWFRLPLTLLQVAPHKKHK